MKLLAVADLHGAAEAGSRIVGAAGGFDAAIVAGDLTRFFTPSQAPLVLEPFLGSGRPVFAVAGNCDGPEVLSLIKKLGCSLDGHGVAVGGVGLCGVPSGPPHRGQTWELEESELAAWLELGHRDIAGCRPKVLVSHAPPAGTRLGATGEEVPGSTAVRDGALRYGFDLVICGHIHEARGVTRLDDQVTVVNCGPARDGHYVVVEITEDRIDLALCTLGGIGHEQFSFPLSAGR